MEGSARAADTIGIRATLVPYVADLPEYDYFETLESNLALLKSHRVASNGRVRTWVGLEHLLDAIGRNGCTRDHRDHEGGHHHRHQDLHQIREVRDQRSDLDAARADATCAEPEHRDARRVDEEVDRREHRRHQPTGSQRHLGQVLVRSREPAAFLRLTHERAHHADARDLLAQNAVDLVDPLLHQSEGRHHPRDEQAEYDACDRHGEDQHDR